MKRITITNLLNKKFKISHDRKVSWHNLPTGGIELETEKDYFPYPVWRVTEGWVPYRWTDYKLMSTWKLKLSVVPYMKLFGNDIEPWFTIDDVSLYLTENNIDFTRDKDDIIIEIER